MFADIFFKASFSWSFRYLLTTPNPINDSFGWHLQYLTIIGLALSSVTFAIGLVADVVLSPFLFNIKNALAVVAAPLEILISLLYWGLRCIDPRLVVPPMAPPLDVPTDLSFHMVPSLVMLIDILFLSPPWTITAVPAIGLSISIAVGYWLWVEQCFSRNGFYPYPIFEAAGLVGRAGLFAGSALIMALGTLGLRRVYALINGTGPGVAKKTQ